MSEGIDLIALLWLSKYDEHARECVNCVWPEARIPVAETSCSIGGAILEHAAKVCGKKEFEEAASTMHDAGAAMEVVGSWDKPEP